jgi:hypothetical protein
MTLDIDEIEAILRQYWQIPSNLPPRQLRNQAFIIQVMVSQKYAHDNLNTSWAASRRFARTGCRYCVIEAVGFGLERLMAGEMMPSPNMKLAPSMSPASGSRRYAASSL